jgi:hypothetical protein
LECFLPSENEALRTVGSASMNVLLFAVRDAFSGRDAVTSVVANRRH